MKAMFKNSLRPPLFSAVLLVTGVSCLNTAQAVEFQTLPGTEGLPSEVINEIDRVWDQTKHGAVRSKHLRADGTPEYANRLLLEKSPYLRQHAHNPVNWYAWSETPFDEAARRDVPVLLSIGYSACHWCHVMEDESYDDEAVARYLNQNFVAVKVDRETNPEVDEIHLLAVQLMGGSGGWPLHVLLTPDREPFLGMTYLPQDEFVQILERVHEIWNLDRETIDAVAAEVAQGLESYFALPAMPVDIGKEQIESVIAGLIEDEAARDEFSAPAPRFPSENDLLLLLSAALRYQNSEALALAEKLLTDMAFGGIRDHVGGGFHRYTVDSEWLIPHFEKMLYNQAQIARAYLFAYEITGKPLYKRVALQILDYVLRDMTDQEGVFYSATDADSEGEEGVFFLWTLDEIRKATGDDSDFVISHFGATEEGNFEGVNILFVPNPPREKALSMGLQLDEYLNRLSNVAERMRVYRDRREKPFLDAKIITAWNALMITTLSEASRIIGDERYLDAATRAAHQIWNYHQTESGELYRIKIDGHLIQPGKLRDYTYLLQALVSLYDQTDESVWLERSERLASDLLTRFWDIRRGGLFSTAASDTDGLIVRPKDRFDDALPSGNSVAAKSLSRLYHRTGKEIYATRAKQIFQAFGSDLMRAPSAWTYALNAVQEYQDRSAGVSEYAASGHAKVTLSLVSKTESNVSAIVEIDLDEGWHVQSDSPSAENLIGTRLSSPSDDWSLADVVYPPAETLVTSFQSDPISVWSGKVRIDAQLKQTQTGDVQFGPVIEVRLQACDDRLCLLPETVRLEIPIGVLKG